MSTSAFIDVPIMVALFYNLLMFILHYKVYTKIVKNQPKYDKIGKNTDITIPNNYNLQMWKLIFTVQHTLIFQLYII